MIQVTLSDELYNAIAKLAEYEYRPVDKQIAWLLAQRVLRQARPRQTPALAAFGDAMTELHEKAGRPSLRTIATEAGHVSHTTVRDILRGARISSWPLTERIVTVLGGDVPYYRQLWEKTWEPGRYT